MQNDIISWLKLPFNIVSCFLNHSLIIKCYVPTQIPWPCIYLGTELSFDPVEVVVEVTSLHQFTPPGRQLGNNPCSLQKKRTGPNIKI